MFSATDFVTTEIHERQVVLGDGKPHAVYFRELPNTDLKRYAMWQLSEDEDVRAGAEARLLSVGLVDPNGEPALTWEQAARLKLPIMRRLVEALLDVNQYGLRKPTAANIADRQGGEDLEDDAGDAAAELDSGNG